MAETLLQQAFGKSRESLISAICKLKRAKRLEYVESTGTQWIDTGIVPTTEDSIHVNTDIALTVINTSDNNILFGSYESRSGVGSRLFAFVDSSSHPRIAYGAAASSSVIVQANQRLSITADFAQGSQVLSVNGSIASFATNTVSFLPAVSMAVFCSKYTSGIVSPSKMRLYTFKLLLNGVLVRDYIPVKDSAGVAGLLDLVSGQIFYSATSTALIAGPEAAPYFSRIEYLESTGTQFIDTGVIPAINTKFVYDMRFTDVSIANYFGAFSASNRFQLHTGRSSTSSPYMFRAQLGTASNSTIVFTTSDTNRHTFVLDMGGGTSSSYMTIDDSAPVESGVVSDLGDGYSIYLLSRHNVNGASTSYGALYGAKHYEGDILVNDWIPVRIGTTGYLYDKVTKRLFGNQGAGSFVLGPDIVPIEYLESTGTQYIDTGIVPTNNDIITTKFMALHSSNSGNGLFESTVGAWNANPNYWLLLKFNDNGLQLWSFSTYQRITTDLQYLNNITDCVINLNEKKLSAQIGATTINTTISVGTQSENQPSIKIFSVNYSRLYSMRIDRLGVTIADYVPMRVGSVGYLFDKVTKQFFGNAGTGDFVLGPDVA